MNTETASDTETDERTPAWVRTGVSGLYLHVPTGMYYSRYSVKGKRVLRKLDTSVVTVAKLRHAKRMVDVEEQRQMVDAEDQAATMGQLLDIAKKNMEESSLEPSTKKHHRMRFNQLAACWEGDLYKVSPKQVSEASIVRLRNNLEKELAPATVNHVLNTLAALLRMAVEKYLIVRNPMDDEKLCERIFMEPETRRPEIPDNQTLWKLFNDLEIVYGIERVDTQLQTVLREQAMSCAEHAKFLAFSGMRLEEANNATWEDIKGEQIWARGTKSDAAERWVPIIADMANLLEQIRRRRKAQGLELKGRILLTKNSMRRIKASCRRLGIPELHHHDLRHYFATVAIECGVPIPTVADWLGHSDRGVTLLRTYRHLRPDHSLAESRKIAPTTPLSLIAGSTARSIPA